MLILNAVLLLGVASKTTSLAVSSLPSSEKTYVSSTSKTKRNLTTPSTSINWSTERNNYQGKHFNLPYTSTSISHESSQPGTTMKPVGFNPSQSVTYSPRQNYETNGHHSISTHSAQPTSAPPYLQGGFQASQDPRHQGSSQGFRKPLTPWTSQSNSRVQSKVAPNLNYNLQYFSNPYKLHPESGKTSQQMKLNLFSGGSLNFPNSFAATRPNRQSPTDHPFENPPKFRFNPGFNVQTSPYINSAQRFNNPYQTNSFLGPKHFDTTPSSFSSDFSDTSNFNPFKKFGDIYQYGGPNTVGYSTKEVSLPNSLQFSKNPQSSGFNEAFQTKPVHQHTGLDFQAQPSSGSSFGFSKSNPPSLPPASFSLTTGHYQPPILPVHSSSSTPQLPRYKGASINKYSSNEQSKPDSGYQLLANQPQLHFTKTSPLKSVNGHQPIVYHSSRPFEQIRGDVEVINKNKPQLSNPDDSYDPESDEGFKSENKPGQFTPDDDNDDLSALVKNPIRDVSFEVPSSNLFNSYDEAFGKYSKLASLERDSVRVTSKPVYVVDEDDNDKGDKSEEYSSRYSEGRRPTSSSFEDDDEEESRRSERLETQDERAHRNNRDHDNDESDSYKSYGADYEKEFEESYRRDPPKTEYVHVKEVPEIEDSASESKKRTSNRSNTKVSQNSDVKQKTRQVKGEYQEPKGYESYTSHEYEKPKATYRDNKGYDSRNSYRKKSESASDSDGHKVPRDRGSRRYVKSDDSQMRTLDKEQQHSHLGKSSNNREVTSNRLYNDSRQPSTFTSPSSSNAKATIQPSAKQVSRNIDTYGTSNPQAFINTEERGYRSPYVHREGLEYFTNRQAIRDLTGI